MASSTAQTTEDPGLAQAGCIIQEQCHVSLVIYLDITFCIHLINPRAVSLLFFQAIVMRLWVNKC